ncbi:phage tail-collar fiber domain-containing protein, partial [Escherichia sp. MOD1-EC5950]|uniref:phage tail-collar fiber domain-containing protein n=3 Tax=unclassified Escherichia TaxID=2608889 RepID=UPI001F34E2FB
MSALLTKAFEKWVAECTASNLPARPDAIIFALMEREPTREDNTVPEEKITYAVNELTYGQLSPNNIVCSAVVPDDCAFSYDWICLIHQASGTLCGVIKTPVQQKVTGESLIRNFTIIYSGIAQAAQITVPPQSWQVDLFPEINKKAPLDSPAFTGTPTTPTPPDDAVGLEMANAAFVRKLLAALVDSSPEALDTLNELAAALGNDPNFSTTVISALAGKQPLNDLLTAISELTKRADNLLYFNQDGNVSLSPLSEKARALLALDTPEAMRTELELKAAATMESQSNIRDRTPGRLALPGAFGYGMTEHEGMVLGITNLDELALICMNTEPGRYYTSSMSSGDLTGVVEFIWLDNWQNDKTSQTATKLILFYGRDGRILSSVRGSDYGAPVVWRDLTPLTGNTTVKDAQSDIRDRTPGRLALSGMYGFGQAFTSTEALTFNGQADFAEWLKEATPGRYAVSIADSSTLLAGTTKFNGIIDVMWSPFDNDESDTTRKFKTLLCFNQYYEGEHSIHRLTYRWSGNNWNATVSPIIYDGDSLAFLLSRTAGSGSYFKYPAVGVPVLAVYRGTTSGDKEIKIGLGDVVQGSQLGGVNLSCTISSAGAGSYGSTP